MEVNVKRSSMICPAQYTPTERQWVSNLDMVMTTYHVAMLYIYKPNGSADFFRPQVLKEALSRTLVPFYPMAGRLGCDENGRLEIICSTEGVLWVEAETTSTIDDLGGFTPGPELRKLVPTVDYSGDTSSYPLFMAQVTAFRCGGVSLGIGTQHTLSDGTTASHFMNSWSEMARGMSQITVAPLIDRTLLRAGVPPTPRFHHVEYEPSPSLITSVPSLGPNPRPSSVSAFKITQNQLNTLRAKSLKNGNKTKYSTYTILAAYLWRCASKARGLLYDQPTKLNMAINGRPILRPPLPASYLGNAVLLTSSIALSGDLQSEPLINTIERVHGALQRMDNEYIRSAIDYLETLPDLTAIRRGAETYRCPNLCVISWMRLGLHAADFGWGLPIHMGPANIVHEGKIYLIPSETDDGSLSVVACLETSHMKHFEKHLYEGLMSVDKIKARY
ncbi:hydroxycinnamoyl-CoA shikimate/quinate hydroxycinnamoyl transferase [Hibiscus trionum]|nr:hydroxycinnamoyl-CoA shikimate/quinate hydroxycinnamoyl transferase [Hibiscus trionum]